MKPKVIKSIASVMIGLGTIPTVSLLSTSCSNKNNTNIKTIIDLYSNKPEDINIPSTTIAEELPKSKYFNDQVNQLLTNDKDLLWKEIYYEAFHFINTKGYSLYIDSTNQYKFVSDSETFIDLFNKGIINMTIALSNNNSIKNKDQEVDGYKTPYHDIQFNAILKIEYTKKYSFDDVTIPSSTTLSYIFEFRESNFLNYSLLPSNPSEYYSDGTSNWKWEPYYPSFSGSSQRIFGIIETSVTPESVYPIDAEYMHYKSLYQDFIL